MWLIVENGDDVVTARDTSQLHGKRKSGLNLLLTVNIQHFV